jgi:hypothetical protein
LGQRHCGVLVAAVVISAVLMPGSSFGQPPPTDNSLLLFENLLRDPSEVATNLAYAQTLQASGQIDEAREIYRKVLNLDPNNATASAALAALGAAPATAGTAGSAQTDYTFRVGGAYESNSPRRPSSFRGFDDEVLSGEFIVNDTRQFGDVTLQTNFDLYSNAHNRYSPGDISYTSLDTGPIFNLNSAGKIRVALGGEYVLEGQSPIPADGSHIRQYEFDSANLIFNYFPPGKTPLQSINALVGYDNFRPSESARSGVVARMTAPMVFEEVSPFHTQLIATPGLVHNGSDPVSTGLQPAHYDEVNLDILTLTPLAEHQLGADRVVAKVGVFADVDFYGAHDPGLTSDRLDVRVIPLAGLRLLNFLSLHVQVDLDYRFDHNFSNDAVQRYSDHIVSLTATYRF